MLSLDNYCKQIILNKYKLPNGIFRTFEEFIDLNNLNDDISEECVNFFYNYNINDKFNRCIDNYETKYTDDLFEEIRNNGGYIYHITSKKLKETIQRTGLRPKVGKLPKDGGYRYFPERLYFVKHCKNKDKLKQTLYDIVKDKQLSEYIIIKVKLGNHNISLYKDTAYDKDDNIYTYCAISPKIITIYDNIDAL